MTRLTLFSVTALVTVHHNGVDIANLLMEGILDKAGHIPLNGDELCFEAARCQQSDQGE